MFIIKLYDGIGKEPLIIRIPKIENIKDMKDIKDKNDIIEDLERNEFFNFNFMNITISVNMKNIVYYTIEEE